MRSIRAFLFLTVILFTVGCVPTKKLEQEQAVSKSLRLENDALKQELEELTEQELACSDSIIKLNNLLSQLKVDTADCGQQYRQLAADKKLLETQFKSLQKQKETILASSSSERQRLMNELDTQRRKLQEKETALNQQQASIKQLQSEIEAREKKVNDLEELLRKKDEAVAQLKRNIEKALLNFDKTELSVELRDGKIYVSLANKLLFKSGSTSVDKKGVNALEKLAAVLQKQDDIDVLVEGHTDDDPIKTNCIKDNWDLSVMRATSITRILLDSGVDPKKIVPSGRGEFLPVAINETSEGKARNRRTEIILAPNLDEIFSILQGE